MKNQALFSLKDKSEKLKCCLRQFLFGALRLKENKVFHYKPNLCLAGRLLLNPPMHY